MKIPIRILQQKINNRIVKFSILKGIKTLLLNFKIICTQKLLTSGHGWYKLSEEAENINDFSLQEIGGELKFVKTPSSAKSNDTVLEITYIVDDERTKEN